MKINLLKKLIKLFFFSLYFFRFSHDLSPKESKKYRKRNILIMVK